MSNIASSTRDRLHINTIWLLVAVGVLFRLAFLGILNLLPEEAYYWNYAQHLDIGYLDHPPMVAWLIYFSESLLGRSEFAVRLPAFMSWLVIAFFMYRFAKEILSEKIGELVVLLLAILPIYMSVGLLMTPDAPFYACWAGALFFLYRAIFTGRTAAWIGAGICLGLGLLSKYTAGLLLPATLLFLLLDKESRHWLRRPQPYLATLLGLALFSPVIYWNAQHQWASFVFQGSRRWSGGMEFDLPILLASILVILTPLGAFEAVRVLGSGWRQAFHNRLKNLSQRRHYLFMLLFCVVPLSAFVVHSIQGQPKLNWTGPVWLAIIPLIAKGLRKIKSASAIRATAAISRRWLATSIVLLVAYIGAASYLAAGLPGLAKGDGMKLPVAWKAYGARIEAIESSLEKESGTEPLIAGLDQYWLTSEASFYDGNDDDLLPEFAAENVVGGESLMWNSWFVPETAAGRNCILVSFTEDKLNHPWVARRFARLGMVSTERLTDSTGELGHFYWRIGYDYQPPG
ncbi:MAG: glycosyltransferase family 39 protein [bacterium]